MESKAITPPSAALIGAPTDGAPIATWRSLAE
jgi:hypothetical protein